MASTALPSHSERTLPPEVLERLTRFRDEKLLVTSAYIGAAPGSGDERQLVRSKADSLLHEARARGGELPLDHAGRLSLRADIDVIAEIVEHQPLWAGTLAIFSSSAAQLLEVVLLPRVIQDRIMVEATPWIRPLLAVIAEHPRCCVAIVDRESAMIWELYLGQLREISRLRGVRLRARIRDRLHGASERRAQNRVQTLARRNREQLGVALAKQFRSGRYDVLVLGGHEHELPALADALPHDLRGRTIGTFTIDPHTAKPATVGPGARAALTEYELSIQRRSVAEVLQAAAAGPLAVAGLDVCLRAGSVGAIRELLVQEGPVVPGFVCDACRSIARVGDAWVCDACGGSVRHSADIVDELIELVIDDGGSIRHVRAETALVEYLTAAFLRFSVPQPEAPS